MPDILPPSLGSFMLDDIMVKDILDRTRNHPEPSMWVQRLPICGL